MVYKIEFLPDAEKDFEALDGSVKREVGKKIDSLAENPFLGKPLGKKYGVDLTGFYKLYVAKKKYRLVYRLIGKYIEVIEIIGIGKRDKEEGCCLRWGVASGVRGVASGVRSTLLTDLLINRLICFE